MTTIKDYEGKSYDLASLQKLAQQLYGVADTSRMSGGVFGTNKGNIGFSYEDLAAGLGGNVSTADQVVFDAARKLYNRGVTDLSQIQQKETRGDIEIQPEMRTEGDPESGNASLVPTGKYITYVTNPDGTRTQQYVSPEVMASAQTIVDPTTGERKIVASNQVTGKAWYAGDKLLDTQQVNPAEEGGTIGTMFGLGETFTGSGKTGYELDLSSGAPKFTTYGDSTNFMDSTGGDLVKFAALVAGGNALNSALGGAGAAAGGEAAFVAADAAQLAAQGLTQAQIEATLVSTGIDSFIAADAAQLAAQGLSGSQITATLTATGNTAVAANGLTAAQIASLAKAGISLAGIAGAANVAGGTGGGLLTNTATDRSGTTSGSADYGNPYYQAIQSKYNQYMPQGQGKDITTDLKNWYDTKYVPNAQVSSGTGSFAGPVTGAVIDKGLNTNTTSGLFGLVTTPLKLTPGSQEWVTQLIKEAAQQAGGTLSYEDAWAAAQKLGITKAQLDVAMQETGKITQAPQPGSQEYVNKLIKEAAIQAGGTLSYGDAWNAASKLGISQDQLNTAMNATKMVTPLTKGSQDWVNQLVNEAARQAGGTLSYNDALSAAQKLGITQAQIDAAMTATGKITPNAPAAAAPINTGGGGMLTGGNTATTVNTNTANTANTNTAGNASTFQASNQNSVNQLVREAAAAAGGTLSYNDAVKAAASYGITPDQITAAMGATGVITR